MVWLMNPKDVYQNIEVDLKHVPALNRVIPLTLKAEVAREKTVIIPKDLEVAPDRDTDISKKKIFFIHNKR